MEHNLQALQNEILRLSQENVALKTALYEYTYGEKTNSVAEARYKTEIYFTNYAEGQANRLVALQHQILARLESLRNYAYSQEQEIYQSSLEKIQALQMDINEQIIDVRQKAYEAALLEQEKVVFDELAKEPITHEQIVATTPRKRNFERYIGLNILNTIGIVLIIIGAIAAARFGYTWATFVLGGLFLIGGEIMNRRKPNIFSLGMTAGGIGILYTATAIGHFFHETISMHPALIICIAITALAFYLSTRYKAQILLGITLIGGYLPIFSIIWDADGSQIERNLVFGMMAYLVLFNLLALLLSFRNKWTVATFVGYGLNFIGIGFVALQIGHSSPLSDHIIGLLFVVFAVAIYNIIPVISALVSKSKFRISDYVLILLNTFTGASLAVMAMFIWRINHYTDIALIIAAIIFAAASIFVVKKMEHGRNMATTLFGISIFFAFIFVPFGFRIEWITPVWMIMSVILVTFGLLRNKNNFYVSGLAVLGTATVWFAIGDFMRFLLMRTPNYAPFTIQFASITAAAVIITAIFTIKNNFDGIFRKTFKYCTTAVVWAFGIYAILRLFAHLEPRFTETPITLEYLMFALFAAMTLTLGWLLPKISRLKDLGVEIIGMAYFVMGIISISLIGVFLSPTSGDITNHPADIAAIATISLAALNGLGVLAIYNLIHKAVTKNALKPQHLPLLTSSYAVLMLTVILITDFGLLFGSFIISSIYIITALIWTIIGFARRYVLLRRFGLGLALFSVAKLFLMDLRHLDQELRILSYFIMGIVLIAISFVYQHFSKKLDQFK